MPTTETNLSIKSNNDAINSGAGQPRTKDASSGEMFKDAFDGASLAGIRGFVDERNEIGGPQLAGIRGFSSEDRPGDGPRMAGIRGYSQSTSGPGGPTFADTAGMMRLRESAEGVEPTVQFRNTGMKAYQDMLGMPALAVS
mgnify:CR=1 FL=1